MQNIKGKSLEEITAKLNTNQKRIANELRFITKRTLPKITETVKWGNITYVLGDKNLAWIIFYKEHVDFGFFRSTELESELLVGTGKSIRHIKIANDGEIPAEEIAKLLVEAKKLEK